MYRFDDVTRFTLTDHARLRMAQRNLSLADIRFVLRHGRRFHRAGAVLFCLRRRDIPREQRARNAFSRLEGTIVVLSREEPLILTAYRNRQRGLQRVKQKPRRSRRPLMH